MIKKYNVFLNESMDRKKVEDITMLCRNLAIKNYTINDDMSIDVNGNVDEITLYGRGLTELPLQFGEVTGNFHIFKNRLTDLNGCAHTVGGSFKCYNNLLTSLEGGPNSVGGGYIAYSNDIRSFRGFPTNYNEEMVVDMENNPVQNILDLFIIENNKKIDNIHSVSEKVKVRNRHKLMAISLINEWDVISDDEQEISYLRLCEVYEGLGMDVPPREDIPNIPSYRLID
jgi:hypothetical protein